MNEDKYTRRKKVIDNLLGKNNKKPKHKKYLDIITDIFFNPIMIFIYVMIILLFIMALGYTTPKKYVGEIIYINFWNGNAKLRTKNYNGIDTIINVYNRKHEQFVVGQIITVWTGGELSNDIASTKPQN